MNKQMSLSFIHDELKEVKTHMSDVRKKEKPNLRKRSFLKILKLRGTRC